MNLILRQDLPIVANFVSKYEDSIKFYYPELYDLPIIIDLVDNLTEEEIKQFGGFEYFDSPFCYGYKIPVNNKLTNYIILNNLLINSFGFTEKEQYASIFHELGHFYCRLNNVQFTDCALEEIIADSIVQKFGLSSQLSTSIRKLIVSGMYCEELAEQMKIRVSKL